MFHTTFLQTDTRVLSFEYSLMLSTDSTGTFLLIKLQLTLWKIVLSEDFLFLKRKEDIHFDIKSKLQKKRLYLGSLFLLN